MIDVNELKSLTQEEYRELEDVLDALKFRYNKAYRSQKADEIIELLVHEEVRDKTLIKKNLLNSLNRILNRMTELGDFE